MRLLFILEYLKPLFQALQLLLTLGVGIFAFKAPRTAALVLLASACFVTVIVDGVYLTGSLQTQWKITLFPVAIRRALFLLSELLYIAEVFLWPIALFFLVRERRASMAANT